MARQKVRRGAYCLYCKRTLRESSDPSGLAFTRDHLVPKSKGGGKWYPCCRACNTVKGDLTPEQWDEFRKDHPRWWDIYPKTYESVMRV